MFHGSQSKDLLRRPSFVKVTSGCTFLPEEGFFSLYASAGDTYLRGGKYSSIVFGGEPEIVVKANQNPAAQRLGLVKFRVNEDNSNFDWKHGAALMLTMTNRKFTRKIKQEIMVCRANVQFLEFTATWSSVEVQEGRSFNKSSCEVFPISIYSRGDIVCLPLGERVVQNYYPRHMTSSPDLALFLRLTFDRGLPLLRRFSADNSHDWVTFAAREDPFFDGPILVNDQRACNFLSSRT